MPTEYAPSQSHVPQDWTNTWNLFDDRKTGFVTPIDLKHIMRSLGRRYTETEFKDLLPPLPNPIPYETFVQLMQQPYIGPTEDDLLTALRAFDGSDCGSLKMAELITLLSSLGEKMPESEVRQLLAELQTDEDGKVSIEEIARFLCTPVPTVTPEIQELQRQLGESS